VWRVAVEPAVYNKSLGIKSYANSLHHAFVFYGSPKYDRTEKMTFLAEGTANHDGTDNRNILKTEVCKLALTRTLDPVLSVHLHK